MLQGFNEAISDRLPQRVGLGVCAFMIQALCCPDQAHALMYDDMMGARHRPMFKLVVSGMCPSVRTSPPLIIRARMRLIRRPETSAVTTITIAFQSYHSAQRQKMP